MADKDKKERIGRIVITKEQIEGAVKAIASEVSNDYRQADDVLLVVLMKGAKVFADDLLREIDDKKYVAEYVKASSYYDGTKSTGKVKIDAPLEDIVVGRDILLVDDIYDTGRTLGAVIDLLKSFGARDVKTCVIFTKEVEHTVDIKLDYSGLDVEDSFIIGYGLDYQQRYRELPYIAVLELCDE